jgi:hypothetical protein
MNLGTTMMRLSLALRAHFLLYLPTGWLLTIHQPYRSTHPNLRLSFDLGILQKCCWLILLLDLVIKAIK